MLSAKLNCAGQGCPERQGCRRYEVGIVGHKEIVQGKEVAVLDWASFDIERQRFGDCPHRLQVMRVAA